MAQFAAPVFGQRASMVSFQDLDADAGTAEHLIAKHQSECLEELRELPAFPAAG
jgi:hypothetical protein